MNRKPKRIEAGSRGSDDKKSVGNESRSKKSKSNAGDKESKKKKDTRDPAVIRAEEIRTEGHRETVEAIVVAFILALLFRAFIAEAFVIPTGSMAPTLMGAHKDLSCDQCAQPFQVGASKERRHTIEQDTVVAGICPNCRHINNLDLKNDSDEGTFNGDRILVSKFAYTLSDPERWDVIVFKFPGNPKQNYIKRLVGLPNETIRIAHGDVFAKPVDSDQTDVILRKPPEKLLAMRHHLYDTDHQSKALIESGFPSRIQPWAENTTAPPTDSWKIERDESGLISSVTASDDQRQHWLRYFHNWPSHAQWQAIGEGLKLDEIDPYASTAISDFYAYDSYITVRSKMLYSDPPKQTPPPGRGKIGRLLTLFRNDSGTFRPDYESGGSLDQFGRSMSFGERGIADYGLHWVGDLILESDVQLGDDCKELTLELIEAGVKYQCSVDLSTGKATLKILDGDQQQSFVDESGELAESSSADTSIRAGQSVRVRMSNCDDQILLWVNDDLISFDGPTTFDSREYRSFETNYPRFREGEHPLDAAPVGVAIRGGKAKVTRINISRDKYYVSTNDSRGGIHDYKSSSYSLRQIQSLLQNPELWSGFEGWDTRASVSFDMHEDQFFPMGDNSPESLDARCWVGSKDTRWLQERYYDQATKFGKDHFVTRDLLVGKALLVFWPHYWHSPLPVTPNLKRIRLIR